MIPLIQAATPAANCCTEELMLMNPPRWRASMVAVIRAIAGTNRPDIPIIRRVETATANASGTAGRFVTSTIGRSAERDISVNTRLLPERSAQRPIQFMLNTVQQPPDRSEEHTSELQSLASLVCL